MQRLITNVLTACLTFSIGASIVILRRVRSPTKPLPVVEIARLPIDVHERPELQSQPIAISICDLLNKPGLYQGKVVVLKGVIYSIDNRLLLYGDCANIEKGLPIVAVDLEGLDGHLVKLLYDLEGASKRPKMEADAKVVGVIERDSDGSFSEIRLDTFDLNLLSALRRFSPKGAA